jgi:Zn-dependent alcohol dehydrogenase
MANLNEAKLFGASSLPNGKLLTLSTTPQTAHVAVNNITEWDVVTIDVNNSTSGSGSHAVTINWGGTDIAIAVAHNTTVTIVDRWRINSGLEIKASTTGGAASTMKLYCHVDRYPAG